MAGTIGIGIVGANSTRGWTPTAHLPALSGLPGFEIRAVSTTRLESARATADAVGAAHAFDNAQDLAACDDVDLVVVAVRVPYHHELVATAIAAGKHVYCEWPLGASTIEALDLTARAEQAGVRHLIGLQGRKSPLFNYVRHLVGDGYLGHVHAATLELVTSGRGGPTIAADRAWTADRNAGVTLLTITGGHTLDLVRYVMGEVAEVGARVATLHPRTTVEGTGEEIEVTAPDHVLLEGAFASGALLSASFISGPRSLGFRIDLFGDGGTLRIEGPGSPHIGDADLSLYGSQGAGPLEPLSVPASYDLVPDSVPVGAGRNVAGCYLALADAIASGAPIDPDFVTACSMHELIDAIEESSNTRAVART